MIKLFSWLFGGLTLLSISAGLFKGEPINNQKADSSITINENNEFTFGYYPQTIAYDLDPQEVKDNGTHDSTSSYYNYKNQDYFMPGFVVVDHEHEGFFNDQSHSSFEFDGRDVAIKVEPIKWTVIKKDKTYLEAISSSVIERFIFDDSGRTDYEKSDLCQYLETAVLNRILIGESRKDLVQKIRIPEYNEWDGKGDYPSDYAIISNLSSHVDNYVYKAAPYWTSTVNGDRLKVRWMYVTTTDCLPSDQKIGIRPVIRLTYSGGGSGGGGGSSSVKVNFTGNVPLIIIGLIFFIGGAIALIVFIMKWHKNLKLNPKFKCKWHFYLIIGILVVVSIVGINLYAYGTVLTFSMPSIGGDNYHIYGLYVSFTYLDDDANSTDWDWAGITHGIYALTKEGEIYHYIGNYPVGKTIEREPGVGSYVVKGKEITLTFPETWRTFTFEHSPMTYKLSYDSGWHVQFVLDQEVSFATQVPPPVPGSGVYSLNYNSYASNHNPDGRPYYTKGELGY